MSSPPEPDSLAELRQQRELVARHLAWLDRAIERQANEAAPAPRPDSPLGEPEAADPTASLELPGSNLRKQRLGCLLAGIALAALAIFLFWGLPLLIY